MVSKDPNATTPSFFNRLGNSVRGGSGRIFIKFISSFAFIFILGWAEFQNQLNLIGMGQAQWWHAITKPLVFGVHKGFTVAYPYLVNFPNTLKTHAWGDLFVTGAIVALLFFFVFLYVSIAFDIFDLHPEDTTLWIYKFITTAAIVVGVSGIMFAITGNTDVTTPGIVAAQTIQNATIMNATTSAADVASIVI